MRSTTHNITMNHSKSQELFRRAQEIIPGGVNSPVRAFKSVGGQPVFVARGQGSHIFDVDGNEYIDYVGSWGPLILGHRHPEIVAALPKARSRSDQLWRAHGAARSNWPRRSSGAVPSIELVRLVNSGTEATMSALRVARGFTGRDLIVKFEGCYHGHADTLLVKAGSGVATLGMPTRRACRRRFAILPSRCRINGGGRGAAFRGAWHRIAAVIVEPVAGNMGCVPPLPGFLEALRRITERYGALLIFDEVMTGFRVACGGAQQRYGIRPDLTMLGKVIGGGLPVGAYGGRKDIMRHVAPVGPVYQAGTLSGNPLAVAAGLAMLRHLEAHPEIYDQLEARSARLCAAAPAGVTVNRVGAMFTFFFTDGPVTDWESAKRCDTPKFGRFFQGMLERGIYLAPSQFEAAFLSAAHTEEDIDRTIAAARDAL